MPSLPAGAATAAESQALSSLSAFGPITTITPPQWPL
jgi:hypothetical protein